ncbi:MAG: glycosyltransferase [Acidobacteriota bacterium]
MGQPLPPPSAAGSVVAGSLLVLAPHYDDEVLGCGGLLLQRLAAGARVQVLFLSDGGGGEEAIADRQAYRERRRREAEAVAAELALEPLVHLDLPDGGLEDHLDDLARGIRQALEEQPFEALLVPSPLEASADHRAVFAALHRLLAPLRSSSEDDELLLERTRSLQILVYEINRPAFPDLLIDVSAEVPRLAELMELYASQQERRDYWRASLGLRQYRTLTLPSAVAAAEGYRRLVVEDFVTRSPAQLVSFLGGAPAVSTVRDGPLVSVIVRTKDRPELLAEALASLADSSYRRVELVLVNDGGETPRPAAEFPFPIRRVDLAENRGRAEAANAGITAATGDYVAFLDDDDLLAPEHLATLVGMVGGSGVRVAYSDAAVGIYELDGDGWSCRERRLPYSRDFDPDRLLVDNYIPFHTLLIERRLFDEVGLFDAALPIFEDWDFLIRLARHTPFRHLAQVTCEYRHFRGADHHALGESPRQRSDFLAVKARVLATHQADLTAERLAAVVEGLRRETVEAVEEASASRQHAVEERRRHAATAERYHRLNGEIGPLRQDHQRLQADLQRLYEEEAALRAVVEDQNQHLGRTYDEIARLEGVIEEMEATRAWRWHLRWRRWTGR